jgi:carbamoyl-phosphate synthase small subunit
MSKKKAAVLVLADGTKFEGFSFGAETSVRGEVVFNTAMLGYPEMVSDPLMKGLIVVLTYPLVGNYGMPPVEELASDRVHIAGLVVTDYSEEFSHWNAQKSLSEWLIASGVPAICGIDTRALAQHIRENGEMSGKIVVEGAGENPAEVNFGTLIEDVSVKTPVVYGEGDKTVALLDTGVQNTIINSLTRRGVRVVRLPWNTDLATVEYDGLMLTGTIDDPSPIAANVRKALDAGKPVFGVCGAELTLAVAAGGKIEKLSHSHRGTNQPVLEVGTNNAMITTQNHAWAVDAASLPAEWKVWFTNLNDGTVEGIRHTSKPFSAVSFHPEASNRPVEADKLYNEFIDAIRRTK